jgi:hypothetical protein
MMQKFSKATLGTTMTKYQRQLFRAILPVLLLYAALLLPFVMWYKNLVDRQPQSYKILMIIGAIFVFSLSTSIPMSYFRRRVRELSLTNGLICPACNAPLGFHYATLKRTGECGKCGAQVADSA